MKLIAFITLLAFNLNTSPSDDQLLPTKLRVSVIDGLGNFVDGATVAIYDEEENYLASENPVALLKTDKKGRVTFKGLKIISYYIQAYKGDKKNDGEGVVTAPLIEGRINKVNTVIE